MTGETTEAASTRPRKRRILKILAAAFALLVLLLVLAPVIAAPIVRGKVEEALERKLAVDASIESLKLSLFGSVDVSGVHLVDEQGRDVLSVERMHASLALLQALGGTYAFDAEVEGLTARVYEEADGSLSATKLPRPSEPKPDEPDSDEPASFDLRGTAALRQATLVLVRRDGSNVRVDVDATATFDGPERVAVLEGAIEVLPSTAAPGTQAGRLTMRAELPGDPGGWADVFGLHARASMNFERPIDLAPLAAGLPLPLELKSGVLGGRGELTLSPGLGLEMSAGYTLDAVDVRGPGEGAPALKLARVSLAATTERDGDALEPRIVVRADDVLTLEVGGKLRGVGTANASLDGRLALDADVNALATLAASFVELRPGLSFEGALIGDGTFDLALKENAPAGAGAKLRFGLEGLTVLHNTQGPLDLGELSDPGVAFEARYDAAAGAIDVPAFEATFGPVRASGTASLRDLAAALPTLGATRIDVQADLDALMEAISGVVVLGDTTLGGTLTAHLEVNETNGELPFSGRIEARALRAGGLGLPTSKPGAGTTELGDVTASLRGAWRRADDAIALDELVLAFRGLDARGSGSLSGVASAMDRLPAVSIDLAVDADPSSLPAVVHAFLGEKRVAGADCTLRVKGSWRDDVADAAVALNGRDVELVVPDALDLRAGSLRVELAVKGPLDALVVTGDGEALALALKTVPSAPDPGESEGEPSKGIALDEPRMLFDVDATVGVAKGDLLLRKLHVESRAITGDVAGSVTGFNAVGRDAGAELVVSGLTGDLVYVPDRIAAALGPILPGELTGAEPEACRFRLDGALRRLDAAAAVEGLTGKVDLGVGRYRQTGLDLGGDAHLELKDGQASLKADLNANGGEMTVAGGLKITPRDEALVMSNPALTLDAEGVRANTGLGPLLGFVHPAFAGLESLNKTELGGVIACDVDLRYDGELDVDTLTAGWHALPKTPIQGRVTFALDAASMVGSPLFQELLGKLNLDARKDFALKPISLDVKDGRLHYTNPWEWTIGGAQTSFGGSIGLDKTLDLKWSIPITDELVARNSYLGGLAGTTVEIPLRGSITKPKLEFDDAVKGLAKGLVKDLARDALKDALGGGDDGSGESAEDLLQRADELWSSGDKAAAVALYQRISDKHKLTLLYLKNRKRIEDRGNWKP